MINKEKEKYITIEKSKNLENEFYEVMEYIANMSEEEILQVIKNHKAVLKKND
jgi:hypothetical protein